MARRFKESKLRGKEREIAELRAALTEVVGALATGERGIADMFSNAANLPGVAAVLYREASTGAISVDKLPAAFKKDVKAKIKAEGMLEAK